MNSKNPKDLTSNDLQTTKSGKSKSLQELGAKKAYHGIKGQISQIPGLSPVVSAVGPEKSIGKRVGVLDSDSEYIKLAKQGGRKGLLYFDDTTKNKSLSADMLLDTPVEAHGNLSVICTKERKSQESSSQRPQPPFWTDNMSAWERDDGSKDKKKKVPDKELVQWQTSALNKDAIKFRRTNSTMKTSPVNMSKLLSFGYAEDDKPSTGDIESSGTEELSGSL
ncbi:uncharacterized protein C7orf57 homolog isoform X2 [Dunckerocampus dactyliophorus]|uniref:uncharacterized protein C7orf57 homolog isoform X2 n=1 Tax=Dunckerocampus dactyliophorus TaxID=161453 RepID=UPI0024071E04|nr:uncharacterized protein C7orf57 homolog isoform X2 [Dunckerocampus dactyliophorus]